MRTGSVGTNSFEKIVVTMYTIRCKITIQMLACAGSLFITTTRVNGDYFSIE